MSWDQRLNDKAEETRALERTLRVLVKLFGGIEQRARVQPQLLAISADFCFWLWVHRVWRLASMCPGRSLWAHRVWMLASMCPGRSLWAHRVWRLAPMCPVVDVRGRSPCKRDQGTWEWVSSEAEGFYANITIFCIAGQSTVLLLYAYFSSCELNA